MNKPPYQITPRIVTLIEQIGEALGAHVTTINDLRLRKIHRIQTIHGSLAIEGNTLTEEQISTLLEGRSVVAPPREIQEVRNAIKAYDEFQTWHPEQQNDLLKAHAILMRGLVDDPGHYRRGGVGVGGASGLVHLAPPPTRVPELMSNLLEWLAKTDEHALIKSSVFHYEFEFIHPFSDGNGRMGRLWQTLILSKWNPLFAQLPVENVVYARQQTYYAAIAESTKLGQSTPFIEFMLQTILEQMTKKQETDQVTDQLTDQVKNLLQIVESNKSYSRVELMEKLSLKHRVNFYENHLRPVIELGIMEMTIPDKPNSRLQKYRLTPIGLKIKQSADFHE